MVDSIAGPTVGHAKRREIDDSTPVIARFRHAGKYNHNFTTDFISIQASGIGLGGKRIHHNKMDICRPNDVSDRGDASSNSAQKPNTLRKRLPT